MQRQTRRFIKTFRLSITFIAIGSLMIMLIPFADFNENALKKILAYFIGIGFWGFTIYGYYLLLNAYKQKKKIEKDFPKRVKKQRLGIFNFFATKEGMLADIMCVISIVAFGIVTLFKIKIDLFTMVVISLLIFSFQMHCILNGENFLYMKFIISRREKNE